MTQHNKEILILGGGLTGLSSGFLLSKAQQKVKLFESDSKVGGLSKTITKGDFRFDLGGHRFFTQNSRIDAFVRNLMDGELLSVNRASKIYMRERFFDYPLKPFNAMFSLGIPTTLKIIHDYGVEKIKRLTKDIQNISLEDWVVSNFGRTMYNIYFKEYSEKVWGIECDRISAEWVAQRIRGLSLAKAVKSAFFKLNGKDIPTLTDSFLYPELGIGRISERLKDEIEKDNSVFTNTSVRYINHSQFRVESVVVQNHNHSTVMSAENLVSTIPVTKLVRMLHPSPPDNILKAASKLRFRDLVIVTLMINRERVTDQTWIYIPEQKIPFGRVHEPTNWSRKMAPEGKTLLVTEFFSFKGDSIWNETDERLVDIAIENLDNLGFVKKHEIIDSVVIRVPKAYPLFEIGYREITDEIYDYLRRFKNLHIAGRSGMFRYYNMDHAIESGLNTAQRIIEEKNNVNPDERLDLALAGNV